MTQQESAYIGSTFESWLNEKGIREERDRRRRGVLIRKFDADVCKIRNLCYKLRAAGINPSDGVTGN
jgi:hypothetical protein